MGRRGAPQPLRLSDPTGAVPGGTTTTTTLTTLTTSPDGNNLNSASSSAPSSARAPFASHRPSPTSNSANSPATATATATSAGVSPIDSRSPRSSPRVSPFTSRFSTRRPHTSRATSNERSHTLQSDEHTPPLPDARPEPSWQSISSAVDAQPSSGHPVPTARQPQDGAAKLQKSATEHSKKFSRAGFFHFAKSSKTSNSIPTSGSSSLSVARNQNSSRGRDSTEAPSQPAEATQGDYSVQPVPSHPSTSELSVSSAGDRDPNSAPPSARKNKAKPFSLLTRTKSLRDKENSSPLRHAAPPLPANVDTTEPESNGSAPKTAPSNGQDRAFRDMMDSSTRNRSEDRAPSRDATNAPRENHRDREHRTLPSATRENGSSNFFSGLRSSSTKAADMISKGLFGKSNSRSGPIHHLDPVIDDEHYELKVINLPLVEQARKTRISKRLETARDKTEFWMPAFPWRAIDYLNYKGCEVEGLYRVPGSGPQIKRWQRKFDEHHDVNLFEAEDLYDINIIGSMLKAWLRELPDELFPKAAQERVSRECAGAEEVPQMLIDELSNLSPFNYYLLFAITCHLSLLLAHSDKNKMDFRNLCICFQPCMKIDAFCFKFLVCDWRNCWKGCLNEAEYIEEEYRLFDQPPPRGLADSQRPSQASTEDRTPTNANKVPNVEAEDIFHESREVPDRFRERQMSSSASSKHSFQSATDVPSKPVNSKPIKKKPLPLSTSKDSMGSNDSSISTDITIGSEQPDQRTPRDHRDNTRTTSGLRRLSPIKPLSPIGF